jgi:hypothetical protein
MQTQRNIGINGRRLILTHQVLVKLPLVSYLQYRLIRFRDQCGCPRRVLSESLTLTKDGLSGIRFTQLLLEFASVSTQSPHDKPYFGRVGAYSAPLSSMVQKANCLN